MITDPIADYLTCIRNAAKARHPFVEVRGSRITKRLTEILHDQGYIESYEFNEKQAYNSSIKIYLKYDGKKRSVIYKLTRISKPGKRQYRTSAQLPQVLNGLGIAIISTSQGIMTNKEAKKRGIGGEEICQVY